MNDKYYREGDKLIDPNSKKILFFGLNSFKKEIVYDDTCFLCGAKRNEKKFNDEHVIPNWILKKWKLYDDIINFPNDRSIHYSKYKIPCCCECNSYLGKNIEEPISKIINGGFDVLELYIKNNGISLLFKWLCLLYFKSYLKGKSVKMLFGDASLFNTTFAQQYNWNIIHHIYCVMRALYVDCSIDNSVFGSFVVFRVSNKYSEFDYLDFHGSPALYIQLGDIGIIAIFDDCKYAQINIKPFIANVDGSLNSLQAKELFARLVYFDSIIENKPLFATQIDIATKKLKIISLIPENIQMGTIDNNEFGNLMSHVFETVNMTDELKEKIKTGLWTFFYDENGNFIKGT